MSRLIIAIPLAVVLTLATFSLMAWMVSKGSDHRHQERQTLNFNMLMVEQEDQVQRRKRSVPEQPKPPEMPQQVAPAPANTRVAQAAPVAHAALQLGSSINAIEINAPAFNDIGNTLLGSQPLLPLQRIEPRYPNKALKRRIEGYVVLSFNIDASGKPRDIRVIEASPKRIFERQAKIALRRWKYQPEMVNGVAVAQPGQTVRLEFKLAK